MRAPDFSADGGVDYEVPVGRGMRLLMGTSLRYSSSYYADILLRADERRNRYAKVNANVTLYGPDDRWELALTSFLNFRIDRPAAATQGGLVKMDEAGPEFWTSRVGRPQPIDETA